MPNRRTRTGCLTCRRSRVKCDEKQPKCYRCLRSGKNCDRGLPIKFVHGVRQSRESAEQEWNGVADYAFERDQPWIRLESTALSFLDETHVVAQQYVEDYQQELSPSLTDTLAPDCLLASRFQDEACHADLAYHVDHGLQVEVQHLAPSNNPLSTPPIEDARTVSRQEAIVFQHYLTTLGPSLDVCNRHRVFTTVIPELAMASPLVFNAVIAASAHHLSHACQFEVDIAEIYHARCVELLIPLLSVANTVRDEVISAVVLLRFFEQMASAITGSDTGRHLTGASAFMSSDSFLTPKQQIHRPSSVSDPVCSP